MSSVRIFIKTYLSPLVGMTAFFLQRVTGVLLLFYLLLHVETVHQLSAGQAAFDHTMGIFKAPLFKLLEIGLLGVVIVHALNGVRIMVIDFGVATRHQKRLFWGLAVIAGTLIFAAGAIPLFMHSVLGR